MKAILRGKFIARNAYVRKEERSEVSNLNLYLRTPENKQKINPEANRRKGILKTNA